MKKPLQTIIFVILFVLFFTISTLTELITDYFWFQTLHFESIFVTILKTEALLFVGGALFFYLFAHVNFMIAKVGKKSVFEKVMRSTILVFALFFGLIAKNTWEILLSFMHRTPFNLADPILGKDAGFYVFTLPFLGTLWNFAFFTVAITLIAVALFYFRKVIAALLEPQQVDPNTNTILYKPKNINFNQVSRANYLHLACLGALLFVLLAIKHYLSRFSVMFSEAGIVVGAGYTDVHVFLPVVTILSIIAAVTAVVCIVWTYVSADKPKLRKRHILFFLIATYAAITFIGGVVAPAVVQSLIVTPNEINREREFIANNIEFTKIAYGLDTVEEEEFPVEQSLTKEILKRENKTIENVRILDYRPLTQTYKQTQEIRLYYDLSGIDIDRYTIDGKYTQVMIAPRELDQKQITPDAQTWVNLHMVYSHGFGVVMSPVNKVTKEGLPEYLIQDIPPVYSVDEPSLKVDQPRVYYGEKENEYVIVNSETDEFDFPKGNSNEYINYDGKGGVVLDSFMKKLLLALRFKDIKILLSSDITPMSKIMFDRSIQKRIEKVTPFLALDSDPYLVIHEGRLVWIQDAYTITGQFPYAQKYKGINYIRNAVKIVVDAYDGSITYYVMNPKDPLILTYAKMFPNVFKSAAELPENLREHVRYPEGLFKIQSEIFSTYHMDDTTVFYNKEDAWEIPNEIYGTGQQVKVEPYYIIMKLPGESKEEFVLMTSFTPIKKDNMISWLAARSDGKNYGKLLLYKFPKDKLIFGPSQIEAKFDQDSVISEQLTLWSQQGSRVTRGNLLVIPINNSLLYIEPLYIQAERGQLPELKRVLVSDGEQVVMERTLDIALEQLFGKTTSANTETGEEQTETAPLVPQSGSAQEYYKAILDAMESGDWESFGENFEKLGEVLEVKSE